MRGLMSVLGFVVVAACATKSNPAASCADGACSDPAFPYCDATGAISGTPNACIAVSCTANELDTCDGSNAIACNGTGDGYTSTACPNGCNAGVGCGECAPSADACVDGAVQHCGPDGLIASTDTCALGCLASPAPHCAHLDAKYLPGVCDTPAAVATLTLAQSGQYDPNLDTNCTGGIIAQTGAPDICVIRAGTITIGSGATISIPNVALGYGGRIPAFVADSALDVEGTLDVSAHGVLSGPGGGWAMSGGTLDASGCTSQGVCTAGGGAGGATAGAAGGDLSTAGGAANGGAAVVNPALLSALVGGESATQGRDGTDIPLAGGGGGGALLLVACSGPISLRGTIDAAGGGGTCAFIGGGGGAGGTVVIEGAALAVSGDVFSNGGGGAAGTQVQAHDGAAGADGAPSDSHGASGGFSAGHEGQGGAGGFLAGAPQPGAQPSGSNGYPGGGGGSVGFLQTYTPSGVTPTLMPTHASPAFQPNGTVPTK